MQRGCIAVLMASTVLLRGLPAAGQASLPAERPGSARAMAMGDAYLLSSPRADALLYNPAAIDSASGIGVSYERIAGGRSLIGAVGATEWWKGGVALDARAYGSNASNDGALSAGLGYAMPVRGMRVGIAAHYVETSTERGWSVDAGVAHRLGPLTIGVAALTLGPHLGDDTELPSRYRLDAALRRRPLGPFDVAAAATAGLNRHGDAAAGAGVEAAWWPVVGRTFVARGGVRYDEGLIGADVWPTLGASFEGDAIVLEYAWERDPDGTRINRFGVAFR